MLPGAHFQRPQGWTNVHPYVGRPVLRAPSYAPLPPRGIENSKAPSTFSALKLGLMVAGFIIVLRQLQSLQNNSRPVAKGVNLQLPIHANPYLSAPSGKKPIEAPDFIPTPSQNKLFDEISQFFKSLRFSKPRTLKADVPEPFSDANLTESVHSEKADVLEAPDFSNSKAEEPLSDQHSKRWKWLTGPTVSDFLPEPIESTKNRNLKQGLKYLAGEVLAFLALAGGSTLLQHRPSEISNPSLAHLVVDPNLTAPTVSPTVIVPPPGKKSAPTPKKPTRKPGAGLPSDQEALTTPEKDLDKLARENMEKNNEGAIDAYTRMCQTFSEPQVPIRPKKSKLKFAPEVRTEDGPSTPSGSNTGSV